MVLAGPVDCKMCSCTWARSTLRNCSRNDSTTLGAVEAAAHDGIDNENEYTASLEEHELTIPSGKCAHLHAKLVTTLTKQCWALAAPYCMHDNLNKAHMESNSS